MKNAHTMIMVAACLHNFGILHDNWIEDAPPVVLNPRGDDEEYGENDDEIYAAIGFEKPRVFTKEMML